VILFQIKVKENIVTDLARRKIVQAIAIALSLPFLPSCGGGGTDPVPTPPNPQPKNTNALTVYPNALDSRVLGGEFDGAEKFILSVEKDSTGKVGSDRELYFIDTDLETSSVEFLHSEKKFVGSMSGIQVTLVDDGVGGLNFGLVAEDQQLEMNLAATANSAITISYVKLVQARIAIPITLELSDSLCDCSNTETVLVATTVAQVAPITQVNVSGCVGEKPTVKVIMRDETGKVLDVLFGKLESSGNYNVVIPYRNTGDQAYAEAANNALGFLSELGITGGFFSSLNNIFNPFSSVEKFTDELGKKITSHLELSGKAADTYEQFAYYLNFTAEDVDEVHKKAKFLTFLGKILKPFLKAYNVLDKLQKSYQAGLVIGDFLDAYSQNRFNKIQLQPIVVTNKGVKYTGESTGLLSPEGPYPNLSVSAPGKISISSLILSPSHPSNGQDYVATGTVSCLSIGDIVLLMVSGSDGYTDETSEIASSSKTKKFRLSVPNAEAGVSDRITLQVKRSGNVVATRTASIVF
jgi:hypothetical protein